MLGSNDDGLIPRDAANDRSRRVRRLHHEAPGHTFARGGGAAKYHDQCYCYSLGGERLTVYRHFQDEAEIFAACSHRYLELNPPTDPSAWRANSIRHDVRGARLRELYAFFDRTSPMFEKTYRSIKSLKRVRRSLTPFGR